MLYYNTAKHNIETSSDTSVTYYGIITIVKMLDHNQRRHKSNYIDYNNIIAVIIL